LGTVTTAITLVVVAVSKFLEGAWIVALLIPLIVLVFRGIEIHYKRIGPQLSLRGLAPENDAALLPPRVVLPISGVHRGVVKALDFACSISNRVTAVYIEIDPQATEKVQQEWKTWGRDVPMIVLPCPYRSIIHTLLDFLDQADRESDDGQKAVIVLPEFIPANWWENLLHNQTAWTIKLVLLYQRRRFGSGRVIVDVPFHLRG
jgi:hypothetical protein